MIGLDRWEKVEDIIVFVLFMGCPSRPNRKEDSVVVHLTLTSRTLEP